MLTKVSLGLFDLRAGLSMSLIVLVISDSVAVFKKNIQWNVRVGAKSSVERTDGPPRKVRLK